MIGDRRERVQLKVEGMCCAEEAAQVEKALKTLDGVLEVQTSVLAEKATVVYDPSRVNPAELKEAVLTAGFGVGEEVSPKEEHQRDLPNLLTGVFVSLVALGILIGMLGERLGLFEAVVERVPAWVSISAVLIGGFPIFRNVVRALKAKTITSHALMTLGILGALAIRDYAAAAVIVFFMRLADFLDAFTTARSREAIKRLLQLQPEAARVEQDGEEVEIPIKELKVGDVVLVKPGEKIPVDGRVLSGSAAVNQAPITGESIPVEKRPGDEVFAATINERGMLKIETLRVGEETTFGRIITLVEEAEAAKAPVQKFADKVTGYYIPVVLGVAALTYIIGRNPTTAVAVLVVACSCAIAMATPVAVLASVGSAARRGILIKGGLFLEALARVDTVVMDKTGTLTFGRPTVTDVIAMNGLSEEEILRLAAVVERYSEHPLASAIVEAAKRQGVKVEAPEAFEVIPGEGVIAHWNGNTLALGNLKLMEARRVTIPEETHHQVASLEAQGKTVVFLAEAATLLGVISVADSLREEVPKALADLRALGIRHLLLLTGDNPRVSSALAAKPGVAYQAELLPEEKIEEVRRLQREGRIVAMVGDGINDAPALAQADVGIAMGAAGTDVAIEAAHVALMGDDWRLVPEAIRIGRRTFRTIQQNLAFALFYNIVGIGLASLGFLPPIWAAAAQSLPDVAIMLNSSRLLRLAKTNR